MNSGRHEGKECDMLSQSSTAVTKEPAQCVMRQNATLRRGSRPGVRSPAYAPAFAGDVVLDDAVHVGRGEGDKDQFGAAMVDVRKRFTQLRDLLAAEDSTEVTE